MNEDAEKAKEQAAQVGHQAKAATKSTGRALRDASESIADVVVEEAQDAAEKVDAIAEDAVEAARRINLIDAGMGVGALVVSIASGIVAYSKFRQAVSGGSNIIS